MRERGKMLQRQFRIALIAIFSIVFASCIDPVQPEFEFQEGLVFVDGLASTTPSSSFVIINRSIIEFGQYGVKFVNGAQVSFINIGDGAEIFLTEAGESYIPPADFAVASGEQWKLSILLPDGSAYESTPELVLEPVPINSIEVTYNPELVFRESLNKFVPGHAISVSFDDPAAQENYYYWSYKSFETLEFCEKCREGLWRDGECMPYPLGGRNVSYFDYRCEVECWQIRFPESIAIFDDRFSDGKLVSKLKVGDALLYNKENMVVELQQFSITPAAYQYYKVLKDIVDNNSGLNAPPPAALIGNLINLNDPDEFVFGRFTAAATATATVFVDRSNIQEPKLETRDPILVEPTFMSPYPPPATITAPCSETKFRTAIRPPGWVD